MFFSLFTRLNFGGALKRVFDRNLFSVAVFVFDFQGKLLTELTIQIHTDTHTYNYFILNLNQNKIMKQGSLKKKMLIAKI